MNPEDHMKVIHQWSENLKKQWNMTQLTEQQKVYENYWKMVHKMYVDAADMLVQQWTQRTKENNPVQNTHDLYSLWLQCCNTIYKQAMHSHSYQEAYGDMMNATINFWKSALPK
jgi:hypothetical protein